MIVNTEEEQLVLDERAANRESTFLAMERDPVAAIQFCQGSSGKCRTRRRKIRVRTARRRSSAWRQHKRCRKGRLKQPKIVKRVRVLEVAAAEVHVGFAMQLICVGLDVGIGSLCDRFA